MDEVPLYSGHSTVRGCRTILNFHVIYNTLLALHPITPPPLPLSHSERLCPSLLLKIHGDLASLEDFEARDPPPPTALRGIACDSPASGEHGTPPPSSSKPGTSRHPTAQGRVAGLRRSSETAPPLGPP